MCIELTGFLGVTRVPRQNSENFLARMVPFEFQHPKTRVFGLPFCKNRVIVNPFMLKLYYNVTNRQTDKQSLVYVIPRSALAELTCGKNCVQVFSKDIRLKRGAKSFTNTSWLVPSDMLRLAQMSDHIRPLFTTPVQNDVLLQEEVGVL